VPEDVQALVSAVVGASAGRDPEEPTPQERVLGFESGDSLLEEGDLGPERETARETEEPAVMGAGDGRGDHEQGFVHGRSVATTPELCRG
jgi:hypothetical protein